MYDDINDELKPWVEMLQSEAVEDRLVAVKTLQHIGDEDAIAPLIDALSDDDTNVQKIAITAIWELTNPIAVKPLMACLRSPEEEVRKEALSALKELIAPADLMMLLDYVQEDNFYMQLNVLILLRKIHDAQALPYVLPFFESEREELRETAITTLRYLNQVEAALSTLDWCKKSYVQICTIPGVKLTLAISSGKGDVGKSTTSVNLAMALSLSGAKVGLLDADVYGPNIPQMLGLKQSDVQTLDTPQGQKFIPLEAHGIKVMSVGLLAEPERPLAWRGPILHKIITQFINDVEWGELDYLLIDLPPGTGDAQITIVQESPICGVVMVTTPQQVALSDVRRGIYMFRQVGVPILGIVENMSYLENAEGKRTAVFGMGGGEEIAQELSAPLLGQIPLDPRICSGGDERNPITFSQPNSSAAQTFKQIALALSQTFKISQNNSQKTATDKQIITQ